MHLLKSIVVFIDIFDTIHITIGKDGPIIFYPEQIPNSTVHKLRELVPVPFSATIYKHIPMGRGLGGSSSNAGSILAILHTLGVISSEDAKKIAPEIGADVSMYLHRSPLLMEGIGDKIRPIDINIPPTLYLYIPPFSSSTPMIYRAWDEHPIFTHYTDRYKEEEMPGNALSQAFSRIFNLSIPRGVYLTGSGSAMFSFTPPIHIPKDWDIIEINTRKTGWEMIRCESTHIHTGGKR